MKNIINSKVRIKKTTFIMVEKYGSADTGVVRILKSIFNKAYKVAASIIIFPNTEWSDFKISSPVHLNDL